MTVFKHESMAFSHTFHVGGRLVNLCKLLVKLGFQGFVELLFELRLFFDCLFVALLFCVLLFDFSFNGLFYNSCKGHYLLGRGFGPFIDWKINKLLELHWVNQALCDQWLL